MLICSYLKVCNDAFDFVQTMIDREDITIKRCSGKALAKCHARAYACSMFANNYKQDCPGDICLFKLHDITFMYIWSAAVDQDTTS